MMMPHSPIQRDFWHARRTRSAALRSEARGTDAAAPRTGARTGLRVQVGHWLIGAGSWLSGERVEPARSAPQRAA